MRSLAALTLFALLAATAFAGSLQTVVLDVRNMSCQLCPITVRKALEKVPGVAEASIDFAGKTATVAFDSGKASAAALVKATGDAGYPSAIRP